MSKQHEQYCFSKMQSQNKQDFLFSANNWIQLNFSSGSSAHLVVGRCGGPLLGRWGVGGAWVGVITVVCSYIHRSRKGWVQSETWRKEKSKRLMVCTSYKVACTWSHACKITPFSRCFYLLYFRRLSVTYQRWFYRPHLPRIISNSMQPLRGLSHSRIILQKAQSHISTVLFVANHQLRAPLFHKMYWLLACNRTSEIPILYSSLLPLGYLIV